jgi:hypothetical protein
MRKQYNDSWELVRQSDSVLATLLERILQGDPQRRLCARESLVALDKSGSAGAHVTEVATTLISRGCDYVDPFENSPTAVDDAAAIGGSARSLFQAPQECNQSTLTIRVANRVGESTWFKVLATQKLENVFTAYGRSRGLDPRLLRFFTKGKLLHGHQTAEQLGLRTADSIDCCFEHRRKLHANTQRRKERGVGSWVVRGKGNAEGEKKEAHAKEKRKGDRKERGIGGWVSRGKRNKTCKTSAPDP